MQWGRGRGGRGGGGGDDSGAGWVRGVQIGKLFSAMATVKQKFLRQKLETLADTQATLQSALRIRAQMEDRAHGPAQPVLPPAPASMP